MNRYLAPALLLFVATGASAAMLPGDTARGKAVHGKQCVACHDSSVYTRPDRRIKSVEGLIGQVNFCVQQTGAKLDREQVNDVVKYLDEAFYRFP